MVTGQPDQREAFLCEQCNSSFKTANGLKIHKGKAHKEASLEVLRKHTEGSVSLSTSPLSDTSREEFSFSSTPGKEKEDQATPSRPPPTRPCEGCFIRDPCPYQCGYQPPPTPPRPARNLGKELEEVCRSCDGKLYSNMCCAEEEEVCDDCCDSAAFNCKKARRTQTTPVATK